MDREDLLKAIDDHCERTGESSYGLGKRLLGDKAFVWKLRNHPRHPWPRTAIKIMAYINKAKKAKRRG
jgi:hypothetical protein